MSKYLRGWGGVRALFVKPEQQRGIMRYNIPKRYAHDTGGHVRMTYDLPTGAEMFHGQRYTMTRWWIVGLFPGLYLLFLPWAYEFGDWLDTMKGLASEDTAAIGYAHYITEVSVQRNRAYEFLRFNARPNQGMTDVHQTRGRPVSTNAGWDLWDQESGRPTHQMEKMTRITNFLDNSFLEKKYVTETKADMDRIREIKEELLQIREAMLKEKGNMYKKVME
eukprot:TRINITY_DN38696_c0_g1_i1.p2 TRINITY_DN38696_c0_g1~~TRINITY_DN38696_c0_g1_i1.p2  ORF type:complete len:221 (+),score=50.80 TRINITY_DN38696_c0_g1_i1:42-704(+)